MIEFDFFLKLSFGKRKGPKLKGFFFLSFFSLKKFAGQN
jgi:hypothetical protein